MIRTVLCFGDSNTHGTPGDDPEFRRLPIDQRWTGRLQRLLGDGYHVVEEGLNGRTIDLDYADRPGLNGRAYLVPCLLSHSPLDVIVLMLGSNDTKAEFGRSAAQIAASWDGFLDDLFANSWTPDGGRPAVILISPLLIDPDQPWFADVTGGDYAAFDKSRALAGEFRAVAQARGLIFLDAADVARVDLDGLHFTADSHEPFAAMVAAGIRSVHSGP